MKIECTKSAINKEDKIELIKGILINSGNKTWCLKLDNGICCKAKFLETIIEEIKRNNLINVKCLDE
jgi:hypothetical protein